MRLLLDRLSLGILAVASAYVGTWAYLAPTAWYENFPGFGFRWLPQLGPYNEHFVKDVGAMYLATLVLSVIALVKTRNHGLVRISGAVMLTFNLLHFAYHMTMLNMYQPLDRVLNVISLGLLLLVSIILVLPYPRNGGESVSGAPGLAG